ncbi:MAG: DUF2232 domain-containing protein [Methyloceanibacter sp.]|nr:DUF2232 domain-containing protein [Methyloceanibacter sp.]
MPAYFLIGAGAGLVSAALFASAVVSAALAGVILYICPLPLFLAGLGWGKQAVTLGGFVGTILALLVLGPSPGLVFAVSIAIPATVLVHLALQFRTVPDPANGDKQIVAWYPAGRLVAATAIMAGVIAMLIVLMLGPGMASYQGAIDQMMPVIHETLGVDDKVWTPEATENLRTLLARALPAVLAIVWITIALLNLWLAGTIAKGSGHALRPWPNLHALEIPNAMVLAFAAALALSFVPGTIGLIATGFAGAFLVAYLLQGLAVIHFYTRGMQFRTVMLVVLYFAVLLLGWVAILVAILGLGEPMFGLRGRASATPDKTGGKDDNND